MSKKAVIFTTLLLVIPLFLITFSQIASAQDRVGCCLETNNNNYCVDYTYESQCKQNSFHSGVCSSLPDCKPITCATPDGCLFNYPKLRCEKELGSISLQAMPAVCMQGCCGIANRGYGVMTKKECQDKTTITLGYELSQMTFIEGLTNERECDLRFAASDRGCCYLGAATCSYGMRGECENAGGIFRQGIYCSQILECEAEGNFSRNCGILPGDKNKLCEFDSLGNQEQCWHECLINEEYCALNNTNPRNAFPECRSTDCGTIFNLINGQSYCYYPYTFSEDSNNKADFLDRSTGLQFTKLVCNYGELQVFGLGADRNTICENKTDMHATTRTNNWQRCQECGKGSSITDFVGEYFRSGITMMDIGFEGFGFGFGRLLEDLAKICDEDSCTNLGDCVYDVELQKRGGIFAGQGQEGLYINQRDIGASCSPLYSPGTTINCGQCGAGGDGLFNVCDQQECYRLGDCSFEKNNILVKTGMGTAYALGLASAAKFNAIPIYVAADCTTNPSYFTCVASGVGEEVTSLTLGPITMVIKNVFGVISGGKEFGIAAATEAVSTGKSLLGLFKK